MAQIQEIFRDKALAEYPLVSRKAEFKHFRQNLIDFFKGIIYKAAEQGILYDNAKFIEDLRAWFVSMSSSSLRSFRHTSALIWLTITTKLCDIHVAATHSINQNQKILEAENKKSRASGARIAQSESGIQLASSKKEFLEKCMDDIFETIFVHRYRDVDPKIRIECMKELGTWMEVLPTYFFESKYIRYFGWLLSDINAHTRLQVLKSLTTLYKIRDYIPGFRHFTDRFRLRIVEMAVLDADTNVRVAAIDLLCVLRDVGFLEESDIEVCCRLVFDLDHRVRKSASRFILANVMEESKRSLNEFSSRELKSFSDTFTDLEDNWLAFKELCYTLKSEREASKQEEDNLLEDLEDLYPSYSSRISLAGEALWDAGFGLHFDWIDLISQLLFDFSSLETPSRPAKNYVAAFTLEPDHERILLELLFGFVKGSIDEVNHRNLVSSSTYSNMRKKKISGDEMEAKLTQIHAELIDSIPKLLQHYSHSPEAIVQVLRLHSLLDLNVYSQLHMESKYSDLFSSVITLFKGQSNKLVLEECANVFSKAVSNEPQLPFFEEAQRSVNDAIEDIGYDLKTTILEEDTTDLSKREIEKSIIEPVLKIDALSRNVDIQSVLEITLTTDTTSEDESPLLVQKFKEYLVESATRSKAEVNLPLVVSLVNLIRSYAMWKLSKVVEAATTASSGGSARGIDLSQETNALIIATIKDLEQIVNDASSLHARSICAKALLDLLVTASVAIAQVTSLTKNNGASAAEVHKLRLLEIPTQLSSSTQEVMIGLFLKKERAYAKLAEVELKQSEQDAAFLRALRALRALGAAQPSQLRADDGADSDSDLSDLSEIESDDDEEMLEGGAGSQVPTASQAQMAAVLDYGALLSKTREASARQQKLLLVDYDLCQFAAKVRVAAIARILEEDYVRRISLNAGVLSSLYAKVIAVSILARTEEPAPAPRRKRRAGSAPNGAGAPAGADDAPVNGDDGDGAPGPSTVHKSPEKAPTPSEPSDKEDEEGEDEGAKDGDGDEKIEDEEAEKKGSESEEE